MKVQKRDGNLEEVSFDKIIRRISILCTNPKYGRRLTIDPITIAQKVCSEIYDNVKTSELDALSSQISISMYSKHPDFGELASRIIISNHQKETSDNFSDVIDELYQNNIIQKYLYEFVMIHKDEINNKINHNLENNLHHYNK